MEFILELFWGLWLVMPMLVGAAAVAEERKLGTLGSQLCQPFQRRKQFVMKLCVVVLLTVLFGVVAPLLLEGERILPANHLELGGLEPGWQSHLSPAQLFFCNGLGILSVYLPMLTLAGMAIAIGAISFYASTLTRNTLQALAPAVLGIIIFAFLLFNAYWPEFLFHYPVWHGSLVYFIGIPVFVVLELPVHRPRLGCLAAERLCGRGGAGVCLRRDDDDLPPCVGKTDAVRAGARRGAAYVVEPAGLERGVERDFRPFAGWKNLDGKLHSRPEYFLPARDDAGKFQSHAGRRQVYQRLELDDREPPTGIGSPSKPTVRCGFRKNLGCKTASGRTIRTPCASSCDSAPKRIGAVVATPPSPSCSSKTTARSGVGG